MATPEEMDQAAKEALDDLIKLDEPEAVTIVADWWKFHYPKAGHKRLARALLSTLDEQKTTD